jgi:short-subunit dehydrogenase
MKNRRIWLVTGISSGIGKALAEYILSTDDFMVGTFRKKDQVENFNLQNTGNGKAYLLDLANPDQIIKTAETIKEELGRVDILVNNAGTGFIGSIEETSAEEARMVMEINFFAPLVFTKAILPLMRQQKSGHIIQISSHGGVKAFGGFGLYNASKFALEGFSEALAQELAPLGIALTLVEPGPFRTHFANKNSLIEASQKIEDYENTAGAFRAMLKGVDGKQEGDPKKAAQIIYDLANNDNPPLRLPLGKVPLKTIQAKIDSLQSDLDQGAKIASSAVFE